MGLAPRLSATWASMKLDGGIVSSRGRMFRFVAAVLLFCLLAYMVLWLPLSLLFRASHARPSSQNQWMLVEPGEEQVLPLQMFQNLWDI
jgi:hypothetical protein